MKTAASNNTASERSARQAAGAVLMAVLLGLGVTACQRPLLSPDLDRTQYDRYDTIRNQKADQFVEDEFGRRHPNLRGRLLERD